MNEILSHLALIVCLLGLAIFTVCSMIDPPRAYPNVKRVGEIMFGVGLLAVLLGK